ncbi:MAG TPA: shikimate kinase [Acidimicrobiia bacterium]
MTGPHLVLVGLMGAGKSTVGARCAKRLGRPFVDTDDLVQMAAGMTVADVFSLYGEGRFRALEREAVADACASPRAAVIACGGGAVGHADNRRVVQSAGVVVWLQAPPEVLVDRVGRGSARAERPLLVDGPATTLERLAIARAAAYEAVADVVVDTGDRSVDEVVAMVLAAYDAHRDGEH